MLEGLKLPPQKLSPPPCAILWCRCKFTAGKQFLSDCIGRMYFAIGLQIFITVVRQILIDQDMDDEAAALLAVGGLACTFVALSSRLPLDGLLGKFVLPHPNAVSTSGLRAKLFLLFFALIGGFHNIFAMIITRGDPPCQWWHIHEKTVIACELVLIGLIGHRVWCPPFQWSFSRTSNWAEMNELISVSNSSTGSYEETMAFLRGKPLALSAEVIGKVLNGTQTIQQARLDVVSGAHAAGVGETASHASGPPSIDPVVHPASTVVSTMAK